MAGPIVKAVTETVNEGLHILKLLDYDTDPSQIPDIHYHMVNTWDWKLPIPLRYKKSLREY